MNMSNFHRYYPWRALDIRISMNSCNQMLQQTSERGKNRDGPSQMLRVLESDSDVPQANPH
jgi:hypothetical protein